MQYQPEQKQPIIARWDWVLIIGLILAPMNELRVWKIGPGEVLCLVWCFRYFPLLVKQPISGLFTRFWLLFLSVITLGAVFGELFYPDETDITGVLTYVYFFVISVGVYVGIQERTLEQTKRLIYLFGILATGWYMFLYIYSKTVSVLFLRTHLWYYRTRFSGGANNPHQIAVLLSAVTFCNVIHVSDRSVRPWNKVIPAICLGCCIFLAQQTKSSTLLAALVITLLGYLYYMAMRIFSDAKQKWLATAVLILLLSIFLALFRERLYDMIYEWVASDANGMGRFSIFESIGITLRKSLLFGLGPGKHGMDGTIEYHNSYLEILAMGGLLGIGLFGGFTYRLFKNLCVDPALMFGMVPLYAYSMGGFAMRRLVFWGIAALLAGYAELLRKERTKNEPHPSKPVLRYRKLRS